MQETERFLLSVAQAIKQGQGFPTFGSSAFGVWWRWWWRGGGVAVAQAFFIAFGDGGNFLGWDEGAVVVVSAFELKAVI